MRPILNQASKFMDENNRDAVLGLLPLQDGNWLMPWADLRNSTHKSLLQTASTALRAARTRVSLHLLAGILAKQV